MEGALRLAPGPVVVAEHVFSPKASLTLVSVALPHELSTSKFEEKESRDEVKADVFPLQACFEYL